MDNESVADQMNEGLYLAPELIGEGDIDPLLVQAFQNVSDDAEDYENAAEARQAPPPPPKTSTPRAFDPKSSPEFRAELVELVRILGRRAVAVLGGAGATGELADWIHGFAMPQSENVERLHLAYGIVKALQKTMDDKGVERWFVTKNDALKGQMPIECLVLNSPASITESVRKAAAAK